jgi:hypothetical protein
LREQRAELFEIVEENMSAREMPRRNKNNWRGENNNGETIEQQHGTRGPGTFSRAASAPLPIPPPQAGRKRGRQRGASASPRLCASKNGKDGSTDHFLLLADRC